MILDLSRRADSSSPTHAMRQVYSDKEKSTKEYIEKIILQNGQIGMIVYANGEIVGLDLISNKKVFKDLFEKILTSYVIECIVDKEENHKKSDKKDSEIFIENLKKCEESEHKSPGYGKDLRYHGENTVGSILYYKKLPIHSAFFGHRFETENKPHISRMNRRRAYRTNFK